MVGRLGDDLDHQRRMHVRQWAAVGREGGTWIVWKVCGTGEVLALGSGGGACRSREAFCRKDFASASASESAFEASGLGVWVVCGSERVDLRFYLTRRDSALLWNCCCTWIDLALDCVVLFSLSFVLARMYGPALCNLSQM